MRYAIPLILLLPVFAFAQTKEMIEAVERKLADQRTAKWVLALEAPDGGFYLAPQDPNVDAAPRADAPRHQRRGPGAQVPRVPAAQHGARRSTRRSC